jgi:hypothetical protein
MSHEKMLGQEYNTQTRPTALGQQLDTAADI